MAIFVMYPWCYVTYEIWVLTLQESLSNVPAQIFLASYNLAVKVGLLTQIIFLLTWRIKICTTMHTTVFDTKGDNSKI